MGYFLEISGVLLLIVLGWALGRLFSRLRRPWWIAGYALPLSIVLIVAAGRLFPTLTFQPPFAWITLGRMEFALLAAAITMMFNTLLPQLRNPRARRLLFWFMVIAAPWFSLTPFVGPLLVRRELNTLQMEMLPGGVCIQRTAYTCGPAAAVSALWQLGVNAGENDLAILAHSNPFTGTPEDLLIDAINGKYGGMGVECRYRRFHSLQELQQAGLVIALVRFSLLVDHYVTVLGVNNDTVFLIDPAEGAQRLSHDQFLRVWKKTGIVLRRQNYHFSPPLMAQPITAE